ncbi:hypothetical protein Tco_0800570 [Tanacetum coccineum]|uniref:Uncharacterized protein n=1 Tax=Tanacetum coccineum TaxID=301880 RepID=A0ABQ4ZUH4_9ASTR
MSLSLKASRSVRILWALEIGSAPGKNKLNVNQHRGEIGGTLSQHADSKDRPDASGFFAAWDKTNYSTNVLLAVPLKDDQPGHYLMQRYQCTTTLSCGVSLAVQIVVQYWLPPHRPDCQINDGHFSDRIDNFSAECPVNICSPTLMPGE